MEKKKIIGIVASIIIVVLIVIGISYAFLAKKIVGEKGKIIYHTGSLDVILEEDSTVSLDLENAIPTIDEAGMKSDKVYRFTVKNNSSTDLNYEIYLDDDSEALEECGDCTAMQDKDVKYQLKKGDDSVVNTIENRKLKEDRVAAGKSNTYELRLWINIDATTDVLDKYFYGKIRVEVAQNLDTPSAVETLLAKYTNTADVQDYDVNYTKEDSSAKENKMYVFQHARAVQQANWNKDELVDYRYVGKDPNNYVTFNNETAGWRIIGIETVEDRNGGKEKRIKLIRKDPLTVGSTQTMVWDNKRTGVGSAVDTSGSNDWTDSRLMYLLNPNHTEEKTGVSGSIYWNRQSGNCPTGKDDGMTACDFSEVGLLPESREMVEEAKWFLGGTASWDSASTGMVNQWYSYERGATVYFSSSRPRQLSWIGSVGLLYPSDYGYATSGGSATNRDQCLNTVDIYHWMDSYAECSQNNWLFDADHFQWTISSSSKDASSAFMIARGGLVNSTEGNVNYLLSAIRPVVYLKADVLYTSGDGSSSNPFVLERKA